MTKNSPRIREVPAVTRAVAILRLLGASPAPKPLKAIAESLDIVPSTALHILRALASEGLVKMDAATKRYSLGAGMLPLARNALKNSGFPSVVQPHLDRLAATDGVTAIGVEVSGLAHIVVNAISRSDLPVRLHVDIGSQFPALISASGRCVAAFGGHDWADIERHFAQLRWQNAPDFATWRREVEEVRERGYSVDRGNYIAGISIVAVPVLDPQRHMAFGIVAVGLGSQLVASRITRIAVHLQDMADEVATQLFAA
jgi:DNA-binding IclR family transcriptional regulator